MFVKPGVVAKGLTEPMLFVLGFVEAVWRLNGLVEPTLTSALDGKHSATSLHYSGNAVDIRTRDMPAERRVAMTNILKRYLDSAGYDIALESDHIHIEWDRHDGDSEPFKPGVA